MKIRISLMSAAAIGLSVMMTLGGCTKKEKPVASVQSQTEAAAESTKAAATEAAGTIEQTTCPVMDGNKINKDIFTEYKGKKVYFCCPACVEEFKKDPEKYVSKLPQFAK
jgi:membrane fusion protein, copper/silver efflux system